MLFGALLYNNKAAYKILNVCCDDILKWLFCFPGWNKTLPFFANLRLNCSNVVIKKIMAGFLTKKITVGLELKKGLQICPSKKCLKYITHGTKLTEVAKKVKT